MDRARMGRGLLTIYIQYLYNALFTNYYAQMRIQKGIFFYSIYNSVI